MPSPTSWSPTTTAALTGVDRIDAVIAGAQWASAAVSFSFPQADASWSTSSITGYGPVDGGREPWVTGYEGLFDEDQVAVRDALSAWSAVSGLVFTEVAETASKVGDLRFAYMADSLAQGAQAYAYYPDDAAYAGDVWFNAAGTSYTEQWTPGSYEYFTALHEIGHALGLKHPFDTEPLNSTRLPSALDTRSNTIMSYSALPGDPGSHFSFEPTTPMVLDIAAIQALYGANATHNAGDTLYRFQGGVSYHQTLEDAGGRDTIELDAGADGIIDLRAGLYGSRLAAPVFAIGSDALSQLRVNNVYIALGTVIEDAFGGRGDDRITGNAVANRLQGREGNDTVAGGGGEDRLLGGIGADDLSGGPGADRLNGGGGADLFRFDTRPGAGGGFDTLLDFVPGVDGIVLDRAAFPALAPGSGLGSQFRAGAGVTSAQSAGERLLYDSDTGALYYDPDGTGGALAVQLAQMGATAHPALSAGDFTVIG